MLTQIYVARWRHQATMKFRIHFTLGRSGKLSKQTALWRWLSELMVNARSSWCDLPGSKSKKHDKILMQNWNVILLNLIYLLDGGRYPSKDFCVVVIGTLRQSVAFPGASGFGSWHRVFSSLQWRHNERDGVSPHDCLPKRLIRRRSKKSSKLRVTCLGEGSWPLTGEFPAQRARNAEKVSMWWRHHIQRGYEFIRIWENRGWIGLY